MTTRPVAASNVRLLLPQTLVGIGQAALLAANGVGDGNLVAQGVAGPHEVADAESLFRTAKYRPEFPAQGFVSLDEARAWAAEFVRWYDIEHRHSGTRYVGPQQRHAGDDQPVRAARHALHTQARQRNPRRWSGNTRDWSHIGVVTLNPERESPINMAASAPHTQQNAA